MDKYISILFIHSGSGIELLSYSSITIPIHGTLLHPVSRANCPHGTGIKLLGNSCAGNLALFHCCCCHCCQRQSTFACLLLSQLKFHWLARPLHDLRNFGGKMITFQMHTAGASGCFSQTLKRIKWWMTQTRMVGKLEKLVSNSWVTTFNSLWPLCKMEIADPAFAQVFVIGSRWGFLLHVNLHDHSIGNCYWERRRLVQCTSTYTNNMRFFWAHATPRSLIANWSWVDVENLQFTEK